MLPQLLQMRHRTVIGPLSLKEVKMFFTVSRLVMEMFLLFFAFLFFKSLQESFQWQILGHTPTDPSSSSAPRKPSGIYFF